MLDLAAVAPLPPGTRLVHIGPHKTGTTALQSAFHTARPALARQGVHYAGRSLQPSAPVTALTGRSPLRGEQRASTDAWDDLAREVRETSATRVALSSEYLCDLDDDLARRVVRDLGGDQVHVLVTLRPLGRLTPSQWQQYVQNAHATAWDRWLERTLREPPERHPSPSFWHRHRHDRLVARWADVVGRDRLTVLVVDEHDRTVLPRAVERLLDLRTGTLVPRPDRGNRGLTEPETEVVRRLNRTARREGWSDGDYADAVRVGVAQTLKSLPPDPGDRRLRVPAWAAEELVSTGRSIADGLATSGVRVLGDPATLADAPPPPDDEGSPLLRLDHATAAVGGAVLATGHGGDGPRARIEDVGSGRLAGLLLRRSAAWLLARARLSVARRSTR